MKLKKLKTLLLLQFFLFLQFFYCHSSYCNLIKNNTVYVWQRKWNENIYNSVIKLSDNVNKLALLAAEFSVKNDRLRSNKIRIKWEYLQDKKIDVAIVLRFKTETKDFVGNNRQDLLIEQMVRIVDEIRKDAAASNIKIKEIQFDYDCPSARLNDYSILLKQSKLYFPDIKISITALPTWIRKKDFKNVIENIDYFVLQLHAFEKPKNIADDINIFFRYKAIDYVQQAQRFKKAFYVSLPTYGYEVSFAADGQFLGIRAETSKMDWKKDVVVKKVTTDPVDILKFLNNVTQLYENSYLSGFCWFRLPIENDEFNWSLATFDSVLKLKKPKIDFRILITKKNEQEFEVFIENKGQVNINKEVSFCISWSDKVLMMYDLMPGYIKGSASKLNFLTVVGEAPNVNNKKLVAWFSVTKNIEQAKDLLKVSRVVILKDD